MCLKAESSTCSSVCVCDITVSEHSPFQPHQGQRCSNFGPLSCVGLSLGLQYVLQGDVLLWILNIHSSNFLYRMHHIRSWWCGKKIKLRTVHLQDHKHTCTHTGLLLTVILPLMSDLMIPNTFDPRQSERGNRQLRAKQ